MHPFSDFRPQKKRDSFIQRVSFFYGALSECFGKKSGGKKKKGNVNLGFFFPFFSRRNKFLPSARV